MRPKPKNFLKKIFLQALQGLETLYKKNKINFSFVYLLTLISIGVKIESALKSKPQWFEQSIILIPILVTALHFLFYVIYKYGIRRLIFSHTGVGKHRSVMTFDALTRNGVMVCKEIKGDLIFKNLKFETKLEQRFVFPFDEHTRRLAGEINYVTFSDTVWSGNNHKEPETIEVQALQKKVDRNNKHLLKNPKSILLIKNKIGNWMGFTHVIPMSSVVWEKYLRGEIGDIDFPAHNICSSNEQAYGLLIFSIGNLLKFSNVDLPLTLTSHLNEEVKDSLAEERDRYKKMGKDYYDNYLRIIYKAVLFQINELIKSNFGHHKIIPVMIQIEDEDIRATFEINNFIKQKITSKDGYDIYIAHLVIEKGEPVFVD